MVKYKIIRPNRLLLFSIVNPGESNNYTINGCRGQMVISVVSSFLDLTQINYLMLFHVELIGIY
jgi:hypothetical protein